MKSQITVRATYTFERVKEVDGKEVKSPFFVNIEQHIGRPANIHYSTTTHDDNVATFTVDEYPQLNDWVNEAITDFKKKIKELG